MPERSTSQRPQTGRWLRLPHRHQPRREPRHEPRHRAVLASRPVVRGLVAAALVGPAVIAGVAASSADDTAQDVLAAATETTTDGAAVLAGMSDAAERVDRASRSSVRTMPAVTMKPKAVDHLWATAPLNVWTGPGENTKRVGLVKWGTKLAVTGQRKGGWAEVLVGERKQDRWVNARYLAESKPKPEPEPKSSSGGSESESSPSTGVSGAPCPDGSDVESGLSSTAPQLYRAICNAFPALTTYGGYDPHGEHADGRAIDFMVSDKSLGDAIAQYAQANASALGIRDIIWYQRIWTPERSSEGWRYMGDQGSPTANHMDHVHIAVY